MSLHPGREALWAGRALERAIRAGSVSAGLTGRDAILVISTLPRDRVPREPRSPSKCPLLGSVGEEQNSEESKKEIGKGLHWREEPFRLTRWLDKVCYLLEDKKSATDFHQRHYRKGSQGPLTELGESRAAHPELRAGGWGQKRQPHEAWPLGVPAKDSWETKWTNR